MKYEIEMISNENAVVGEGPLWDINTKTLFWTDIQSGKFFNYNPLDGVNTTIHHGLNTGGVAVNKSGGLIIGTWEGVQFWESDEKYHWIKKDEFKGRKIKTNDVTSAPDGSFLVGTGHLDSCTLFKFNSDLTVEIIDDGLELCNGMGFSPDLKTFYSTDSPRHEIYRWDYDYNTSKFSNKRLFKKIPDDWGLPDGMTVDSEGYVWTAIWYGGMVVRFDPDGVEERRINFPAKQTSSAMFGGNDLNELYVTTANFGSDGKEKTRWEPKNYDYKSHRGGELYRVKIDIQGKPEFLTDFKDLNL